MAIHWRGDAQDVSEVKTVQVTAYDAATTYTLTINGKDVSVAGVTNAAGTASALATAWNNSDIPEIAEITASVNNDTVTLTHDTPGVPFTVSKSTSGGTGTLGSVTSVTAATGKNFWSNAENWSGGAVPVSTDDVVFADSDVDCLYGIDQNSVTLESLTIRASYTGKIGLPRWNEAGYYEYRETYLKISATTVNVGQGEGSGSQRIKLNTGTDQTTVNVWKTGQPTGNVPAFLWVGTHVSNAVNIFRGSFAAAYYSSESATVSTLKMGFVDQVQSDAEVYLGSGVTLTDVTKNGGFLEIYCNSTTLTNNAGDVHYMAGTPSQITIYSGEVFYKTTGTLGGNTVIGGDGHLDFSKDPRTKAVTNPINLYGNESRISDPYKVITALVLDLEQRSTLDGINIGYDVKLTRGTPT